MEILIIIGLLLLGMVFFIIEIFFIPGFTFSGVLAGLLTVSSVWYAYSYNTIAGHITLIGSIILLILSIWGFARSKTLDKMSLITNVDGKVDTIDELKIKVGDEGVSVSRLAPMGKVKVNNQIVEAKTVDDFVDQNEKIIVREVYATNILVEKI